MEQITLYRDSAVSTAMNMVPNALSVVSSTGGKYGEVTINMCLLSNDCLLNL
jgi:hypothetical protein